MPDRPIGTIRALEKSLPTFEGLQIVLFYSSKHPPVTAFRSSFENFARFFARDVRLFIVDLIMHPEAMDAYNVGPEAPLVIAYDQKREQARALGRDEAELLLLHYLRDHSLRSCAN